MSSMSKESHPQKLDSGIVLGEDGLARPKWASVDPMLREYYDTEWGMPIRDEQGLYERLRLEAFQAGLSWATILRKGPAFRTAFADFDPEKVARFDDWDAERLWSAAGIVRSQRNIRAASNNATATTRPRRDSGSADFIWSFQPDRTPRPRTIEEIPTNSAESLALSKALRKEGFNFVGSTTMYALMEAVGIVDTHLLDSHRRGSSGVWPADSASS